MTTEEIKKYVLEQIPLSRALGFHAERVTHDEVLVSAPFLGNSNHKNTIFGGSLHCLATLACWSLLYTNLKDLPIQPEIVITKSTVHYLKPVTGDFSASCQRPDNATWERFLKALNSKKRGRIELSAEIYQDGKLAVDFQGTFAAIIDNHL